MQSTMDQAPQNGASSLAERILSRLALARDRLVDKNLRNRLISTNLASSRTKSVRILNRDNSKLLKILCENSSEMSFDIDETTPTLLEDAQQDLESASSKNENRLKTNLDKTSLQKKLKSLYFEAREYEEEQGVNILYLALGFVKWFESDSSDVERYAPLVLLPVELLRDGAKDRYRLKSRDEELFTNISFKLWVREQNDIDFPDIPDGDDFSFESYCDAVRQSISKETRWEVLPEEAILGFFSFNKFLLWRDLFPENWGSAEQLLGHPILRELLMPSDGGGEPDPPIVPADKTIDDFFTPEDLVYVVDADSSQTEAIQTVLTGRNLVIQGPPGTGKSQTITNIISAAVAKGWKVLFIAEKMAALSVVKDRLANVGLGVLCLELHSRKATKSGVLAQIRESLEYPGAPGVHKSALAALTEVQAFLNKHAKRVNERRMPWNFTPFEVLGEMEKYRREGRGLIDFSIPGANQYTRDDLHALSERLDNLSDRLLKSGVPVQHPWSLSSAKVITPMDIERVKLSAEHLCAQLAETLAGYENLVNLIDLEAAKHELSSGQGLSWLFSMLRKVDLVSELPTTTIGSETLVSNLAELRSLARSLEEYRALAENIDRLYIANWDAFDLVTLRVRFAGSGGSFFSIFSSAYRQSLAELRGLLKGEMPKGFAARLALLDQAIAVQTLKFEIKNTDPTIVRELGRMWSIENTNPTDLSLLADWFELFLGLPASKAYTLRKIGLDKTFKDICVDLEGAYTPYRLSLESFCKVAHIEPSSFNDMSLYKVQERSRLCVAEVSRFNEWPGVRELLEDLRPLLGDDLYGRIWSGGIQASDLKPVIRFSILEHIWKEFIKADSELADIDAHLLDKELARFRSLDSDRKKTAVNEVLGAYSKSAPRGAGGEMAILRQEMAKKRNVFPVRKLMNKAGRAIRELKPVFLMSPLSVAQFLEPGAMEFDLVLIDEASQVRPEDALGSIARAKQVVVVGDTKQLPPTSFFNRLADESDTEGLLDDDGAYFLNDVESILGLCDGVFRNNTMLRWHYRSLHPGLIAVSNRNFYDNKLLLPPAVLRSNFADGLGVSFVRSPANGYIRGGSEGGRNLLEAELIAKEVINFAKIHPEKSLGVAAFSVTQRDAIRDLVDEYRRNHPDVEHFFALAKHEPFFVKNLESIQGDERDVIFISVGYGRTSDGRLTQTFGPLSAEGGERRLNVLISRAKQRCTVFSSITAEDVQEAPGRLGVNAFREFLQFAEKGYFDVPLTTERGFDSAFEESVAVFLTRNGFKVQPQVGMSGFFIDIGVIDPSDENRFMCGIECDGATYHSSRSARDRDRLRQQILESRGWRIYRIWSTDWFHRRDSQERRLLDFLSEIAEGKAQAAKPPDWDGTQPSSEIPVPSISEPFVIPDEYKTVSDIDYVEFDETFAIKSPLHEVPLSRLSLMVAKIVEVEGPIHQDEVARRLARACGLEKAGSRIVAATVRALRVCSDLQREGEFWTPRDRAGLSVRNRSKVTSYALSNPEYLPPEEVSVALQEIVRHSVQIESDELIQLVSRKFGFLRCGPEMKRVIAMILESKIGDKFTQKGTLISLAD
jgi:very-short-patch-repair endonuclease